MTSGDAGDSGMDIWAMDVARYGDYANLAYTNAKVQENYRRRFRITFPNEELPAARPLLTTPIRDRLTDANAVWGATFGLEHALWFQEAGLEPVEEVTFHRSNAWECVAGEVAAVRERVGMTEISNYAKYRVTGAGAAAWLSSLLTARMPAPGRITLTAMLNDAGRIVGEFTVARPTDAEEFYLFGSLPAEVHHSRWFRHHLPRDGSVRFEVLGLGLVGLSVAGPAIARRPAGGRAGPRPLDRGVPVHDVPAGRPRDDAGPPRPDQLRRRPRLRAVGRAGVPARRCSTGSSPPGEPHGLRLFGMRALMSLRLEKSYGTWFREYRPIYTPAEAGITRYLRLDHEFIGRAAHEAEMADGGPKRRLVAMVVEPGSGRAGRRHRRRADLARRRGRRLGDVGRLRAPRRASRSRWATCRRSWRRPTARAGAASRSRSSAGAGRRASSPSRCSTRRVSGCASDRAGRRPIVVDGAPDRVRGGRLGRRRDRPSRRGAGHGGTLCLAGDCGNCLAEVDGVAYVRTCQVAARPGSVVRRHPRGRQADRCRSAAEPETDIARRGASRSTSSSSAAADAGRRAAAEARSAGRTATVLDAADGQRGRRDLPGPGGRRPRAPAACSTSRPTRSSSRPGPPRSSRSAPGNRLAGIVTARAAERLDRRRRRSRPGRPTVGRDARPVRGRRRRAGRRRRHPASTAPRRRAVRHRGRRPRPARRATCSPG